MSRPVAITGIVFTLAAAATFAILRPVWTNNDAVEPPSAALIAAMEAPPVAADTNGPPGAIVSETPVLNAADLRLLLERLLGEHVLVLAGASADSADGGDVGDALDAVQASTNDLADAIGLVYGSAGQQAFTSLWTQHIAFFIDRATAASRGDDSALTQADEHLHHYEQDFGTFTQTATSGELPAEVVTALLEGHVSDTNAFVAAHLAADGNSAGAEIATGHARVADIGAGLAAAISAQAPAAFPGPSSGGRIDAASGIARSLAAYLGATSIEFDATEVREELRVEVLDSFAAVSENPTAIRTTAAAWLDAQTDELQSTARALAETLSLEQPGTVVDALVDYGRGRDSSLLDPATKAAHDAAFSIASSVLTS